MQRGNNHFRKEESGQKSQLLKKFLQQDSFQDSNLSVWDLNLALKSNFMQEDLLFKDEKHKKKLQGQMI